MKKYFAQDFKNNKKSELFDTNAEAIKLVKEWNRQGGFALCFETTVNA